MMSLKRLLRRLGFTTGPTTGDPIDPPVLQEHNFTAIVTVLARKF